MPKLVEAENRALLVVAESRICYNADRLWFCRSLFCIRSRDSDSIKSFMIGNKTDWSMRVFTSEKKINYPSYILKAIGIDSENVGDRDE